MSDTVIKVEDVGKLYKLGEIGTGTISHDLNRWYARVLGKEDPFAKIGETNDRTTKGASDYVWALKDVNFEVKQGEVLGIIGRNGAGKSTLLKILAKVTTPSVGSIKIKGRIASLLEVGTGFHPELTGRENVFLNGAILGMTKGEIRKKFNEIVEFSGVERYIDTPVKRYSSGMYVRLAFAVAAFLEPEILIVDEVLAVGDAEFQKKCLGRMKDVSEKDGRTILFVSHNMAAMSNLCTRGIILKSGHLSVNTTIELAINEYLSGYKENYATSISKREDRSGSQKIRFKNVTLRNEKFELVELIQNGKTSYFELEFDQLHHQSQLKNVHFSIGINDSLGDRILLLSTDLTNENFPVLDKNQNKVYLKVENFPLKAGIYSYTLNCRIDNELADWVKFAGEFIVEEGDFFQTGKALPSNQGHFMIPHSFFIDNKV
jgi:lipopolysaccharide transport system ATP-binding protein